MPSRSCRGACPSFLPPARRARRTAAAAPAQNRHYTAQCGGTHAGVDAHPNAAVQLDLTPPRRGFGGVTRAPEMPSFGVGEIRTGKRSTDEPFLLPAPARRRQRYTRLAQIPCCAATSWTRAPGSLACATTIVRNAAPCARRRSFTISISGVAPPFVAATVAASCLLRVMPPSRSTHR